MEQQHHDQEINDTKTYTGEDVYDYTFPIQYQGHVCNNIYQTLLQLIDDITTIDTKYVDYQAFNSLQDRVQNDESADTLIIQDGDQMIHVYSLKIGTQKINQILQQIEQIITDIEKLKIETVKIMTAQEFQEYLSQQEPDQQDTIILNNIYIKSGQFANTLPGDVQKIKQGCKRLILQNVTFNSSVTMQNLFANCSYVEFIEVQCLYAVQSTGYYFQNTFLNCTNLKQIRFPNLRVVDCYNAFYSMIPGCSNLRMIYTPCLNSIDVHDEYNKLYLYGDTSITSDGIVYFVLAYTFSNDGYMFEDVNQYTQQIITLDQYQVYSILDKSKEEQEHGSEDEFMKLIDKQKYQITIGQQTSFYNLKDVAQALNTNKLSTGNYTINNVDQPITSHIGDLYSNKVDNSTYQQDIQTITQALNNKVETSTYNGKMSELDGEISDLQTNKLSTGNYTINDKTKSIISHIGDLYNNKLEISTYQQDVQSKVDKLRVQGTNNQPYDIQIYGMDTWGYDCYELVTPDDNSYILGFTEQIEQTKTYSIFGDNVSYVFYLNDTSQQYKLVIDESTEIQLTKNGENSYSGSGYLLALYDEHTTYIENAIQKINIVLGTILTELKTDRVQMFSPEISANAGLWHSMIDKMQNDILLKANISDVYDKTTIDGIVQQMNTALNLKANTSDVYNKMTIDGLLGNKANVSDVGSVTNHYINQPDTGYTQQHTLQEQLNAIMDILGTGYTAGNDNRINIGSQTNMKNILTYLDNNKLSTGDYTIGGIDKPITSHISDLYNNKLETSTYQQDVQTMTQALNNKVNTSVYNSKMSSLDEQIQNFTTTWTKIIELSQSSGTIENKLILDTSAHTSQDYALDNTRTSYVFNRCIFRCNSLGYMFSGNSNLQSVQFNKCIFYQVTDFTNMFQDCTSLTSILFDKRCRFTHTNDQIIFPNNLTNLTIHKENIQQDPQVNDRLIVAGHEYNLLLIKTVSIGADNMVDLTLQNGVQYIIQDVNGNNYTIYTTNGITDTIISGDTLSGIIIYIYNNNYYFYYNTENALLPANVRTMYHMGYSDQAVDVYYGMRYSGNTQNIYRYNGRDYTGKQIAEIGTVETSTAKRVFLTSVNTDTDTRWPYSQMPDGSTCYYIDSYGMMQQGKIYNKLWIGRYGRNYFGWSGDDKNFYSEVYCTTTSGVMVYYYWTGQQKYVTYSEWFEYDYLIDKANWGGYTDGSIINLRYVDTSDWKLKTQYLARMYNYTSRTNYTIYYIIFESNSFTGTIVGYITYPGKYRYGDINSFGDVYYTDLAFDPSINNYLLYKPMINYDQDSTGDEVYYRTSGSATTFTKGYVQMYTYMMYCGKDPRCIFITSGTSVTSTLITYISTYPSGDFTFSTKNASIVFYKFYGRVMFAEGANVVYFESISSTTLSQGYVFKIVNSNYDIPVLVALKTNSITGMFCKNNIASTYPTSLSTDVVYTYNGKAYKYNSEGYLYQLYSWKVYSPNTGSIGYQPGTNLAYTYYTDTNNMFDTVLYCNRTLNTSYLYSDVSDSQGWNGSGNTYIYNGTNFIQTYYKMSLKISGVSNRYAYTFSNNNNSTYNYLMVGVNWFNCFITNILDYVGYQYSNANSSSLTTYVINYNGTTFTLTTTQTQRIYTTTSFLTYLQGLYPINGYLYVRNVKIISGGSALSNSNNCLTNLPNGTTTVIFQNFSTQVSLQYMFSHSNDNTQSLQVIIGISGKYNIDSLFQNAFSNHKGNYNITVYIPCLTDITGANCLRSMFTNLSTGNMTVNVSFDQLEYVSGNYCMYQMFYNSGGGIYSLTASFNKLSSVEGETHMMQGICYNYKTSGTYYLNLSMPKLIDITSTSTSTTAYSVSQMFDAQNAQQQYHVNKLDLSSFTTVSFANTSVTSNMIRKLTNCWIKLSSSLYQLEENNQIRIFYTNSNGQGSYLTGMYCKQTTNGIMYVTNSTDAYTPTQEDIDKRIQYYGQ